MALVYSHEERIRRERIFTHHDPCSISDDFQDQTKDHTNEETPCLVEDTQANLKYQHNCEDSKVQRVAGKRWDVGEMSFSQIAGRKGTDGK